MTLTQKVWNAVTEMADNQPSYARAQYEDSYDGFTHSSYAGLVESVIENLINDGYDEEVSNSIIDNYVYDLWN
jgi:hypothetical protein